MIVVDASVIVSAYWQQDAFHTISMPWLDLIVRNRTSVIAPIILLGEIAGAITRRTGKSEFGRTAVQRFRALPSVVLLPIDEDVGTFGAELAADLHLHGADAIYVALAARLDIPLITWDQHQFERGGLRITVHHPH